MIDSTAPAESASTPVEDGALGVLLVEDTDAHATLIELAVEEPGQAGAFRLERVGRLAAALDRLDAAGVDVILLDLMLPDSDGLDTFAAVKDRAPDLPIVVMSALSDEALAIAAVREGA